MSRLLPQGIWNTGLFVTARYVAGLSIATPALALLAFWLLGENALLSVALTAPLLSGFALLWPSLRLGEAQTRARSDFPSPQDFDLLVQTRMDDARTTGDATAVIKFEIDDHETLRRYHGAGMFDAVLDQAAARLRTSLRTGDVVSKGGGGRLAVCLEPQARLDLESCLALVSRLSRVMSEPYSVGGAVLYATFSAGFCQLGRETAQARGKSTRDPVLICAGAALETARAAGPGAVRSYSPATHARRPASQPSQADPAKALERGEFISWFQPQISTDTGRVSGFEALARWPEPVNGMVPPSDFLPRLEEAGLMGRLAEVMIGNALSALASWDAAGLTVPQVGVNFASAELSDPNLVDKIAWDLDRFDLTPDRLAVEILESVVSQGPDDIITRNIKRLQQLGCKIDLDDFGTGHASLAAIRRFGVGRIKIDRSYVTKCDRDPEQQRMLRAILTMAEKLNIETLGEGVETVGEHSLLAQLGCTHVQGFGIGRPMPFEDTARWMREHDAKLRPPPVIGHAGG